MTHENLYRIDSQSINRTRTPVALTMWPVAFLSNSVRYVTFTNSIINHNAGNLQRFMKYISKIQYNIYSHEVLQRSSVDFLTMPYLYLFYCVLFSGSTNDTDDAVLSWPYGEMILKLLIFLGNRLAPQNISDSIHIEYCHEYPLVLEFDLNCILHNFCLLHPIPRFK